MAIVLGWIWGSSSFGDKYISPPDCVRFDKGTTKRVDYEDGFFE